LEREIGLKVNWALLKEIKMGTKSINPFLEALITKDKAIHDLRAQ